MMMTESDDEIIPMKTATSPVSRSSSPTSTMKSKRARLTFPFGACRVCSDSATGIHYGIATCEGCKGFFKRSILRKEKYRCYFDDSCLVNVTNRNRCKACRFRRCITEGMSVDGVKMGRIPKLVKERALREQREEQMREKAALTETNERSNEVHARESSCSSISDRSIENDDPNAMESDVHVMAIGQHGKPTKKYPDMDFSENNPLISKIKRSTIPSNLSEHNLNLHSNNVQRTSSYPTFLPDDFTLDETVGLTEHSTGPLSNEIFNHVNIIAHKLSQDKSNLHVQLTEDEVKFIRFLRWSAYNVYLRHSKRVKQLETRMNQMIQQGSHIFPGRNASVEQYLATMPKTLEVLVRSSVFYIQELPGMTNMDTLSLQKTILHRSFDWFMLKYARLLHQNGECYFISPDGTQFIRRWMNHFHGVELTNAMFQFSQCFRELHLNEVETSLVLPLQMCYTDSTMKDNEIPRMLRNCYLYTLYEELGRNHGEYEGKQLCSQILRVLDLLVPLNELYEKNVGSRVLEA